MGILAVGMDLGLAVGVDLSLGGPLDHTLFSLTVRGVTGAGAAGGEATGVGGRGGGDVDTLVGSSARGGAVGMVVNGLPGGTSLELPLLRNKHGHTGIRLTAK